MADEKLNTGPGEEKLPEAPAPVTVDEPQAPAPEQTAAPTPQQEGPAQPEPGDVVVSFDKINELMNEKRQTVRAEVEKEEAAKEPGLLLTTAINPLPPARPRRLSETNCPEVGKRLRRLKLPRNPKRLHPKMRPQPRNRFRLSQPLRPVLWRKESWSI